ncbi:UbiA family prenyltransferase [Pelagibacterium mangrovi]|uniref:UbiA family prenyltransferase n=1 Tax=Pelagibacterium mangrovi TaxID=3119828 RepID=UPI002FCC75BD
MRVATALRLGRVSNLPTVLTNAMAGMALAGAGVAPTSLALVTCGAGLAYVAGMFLNDAFDAPFDAVSQPFRPIPAGLVGRGEVFAWGYGMLGAALVLLVLAGAMAGTAWQVGIAGLALVATIVAYNSNHKENAFGPVLMGLCRVMVYVAAALSVVASPSPALWLGAVLLMAHVMGLTFIAKQEGAGLVGRLWPLLALAVAPIYGVFLGLGQPALLLIVAALIAADIVAIGYTRARPKPQFGRAIPLLIAAIPLLDAMLIASQGHMELALLACLGFPLTLMLQKWVRGT